jgi:hypothetical protein
MLFCSPACRQSAYRARKAAAMPAHQHQVRLRLAAADGISIDVPDIGTAVVREISRAEAMPFIKPHECMAAVSLFHFGIFFGERLGGVVVFGPEYGENLGIWDRYGYTGKIITLQRGASAHWAHPHSASKLIRRAMRLLPAKYRVITASVDPPLAGEIGTVYQAANFHYVGVMCDGVRPLIHIGDKVISERQARRLVGTASTRVLGRLGFDATLVPRRARYFAFRGDKREQDSLRKAIADLIKPYPKRSRRP